MTTDVERLIISLAVILSCLALLVFANLSEASLALSGPLLGLVVGWWFPRNGAVPIGSSNGHPVATSDRESWVK